MGVIEEIRLGSINEHDIELSREMIRGSGVLKAGDILINDRGFLSREMVNLLKRERGVDSYVPLKKNITAYDEAVRLSKMEGTEWNKHPNKKRKHQKIAFVPGIGGMWESGQPEEDVPINSCVVWDEKEGERWAGQSLPVIVKTWERKRGELWYFCLF
jgi:hypothetical protein